MMTKVEYGEDVAEVFNLRPFYDQLTTASLRDAARQYLDARRYVQVTLRPEGKYRTMTPAFRTGRVAHAISRRPGWMRTGGLMMPARFDVELCLVASC